MNSRVIDSDSGKEALEKDGVGDERNDAGLESGAVGERAVMPPVGRFAPSPSGRMHAGNIFAALSSWLIVKSQGGRIVLRIEDLDRERSKAEYIDCICKDFEFLGLTWDDGPFYQADRDPVYQEAFEELAAIELLYPCFCTRADLHAASAPHRGEKQVYPGTCTKLSEAQRKERAKERDAAWRLRVADETISFVDGIQGPYSQHLPEECGDFIIKRSDGAFAYQLAVVVDDADQGVDTVVRGVDLLCSTPQQMYLQNVLGLPNPNYYHIPLLVASHNRRLSKRDHDASIESLMAQYKSPQAIIGHIAALTGIIEFDEPASPTELLSVFDFETWQGRMPDLIQILWRV